MYYHNITKDDMLNGDGLRVVLWVSGCSHDCLGCHNPQTHDAYSGLPFDESVENELFELLDRDYISGLTLSGGDPLYATNVQTLINLVSKFRERYGNSKTIWIYSGYTLDGLKLIPNRFSTINALRLKLISMCDVFVDGRFIKELKDEQYQWAGSTNQKLLRKGVDF